MDVDLDDAWRRIDWAQRDGQALSALVNDYVRDHDPYTVWLHEKGNRRYWTFMYKANPDAEARIFEEASLHLGHILDHYRAALNYLTYQIALLSLRENPSLQGKLEAEKVEFPIFNDSGTFRKKNRVKQLPDEYRTRLEAVQPYNGGNDGLWILHELAREYRHRIVHPMAGVAVGTVLGGLFRGSFPDTATDIDITYTGGPLKDGDDLCSITTRDDFEANMYPRLAVAIGIDHPLCHGRGCVPILNAIGEDVKRVLAGWEPPQP